MDGLSAVLFVILFILVIGPAFPHITLFGWAMIFFVIAAIVSGLIHATTMDGFKVYLGVFTIIALTMGFFTLQKNSVLNP